MRLFATSNTRRVAGSTALAVLLGGICALVVSGCGSSSSAAAPDSTSTSATTTGASPASASTSAFTTCLQQHGVTLPQGGFGRGATGAGGFRRGATGAGGFRRGATGPGGFRRGATGAGGFRRGATGAGGFGAGQTPAQQKAFAACASLRPTGGFGGGFGRGATGATGAGNSASFAKLQACLKQHGVTLGGAAQSATAQSAIAACRSVLPNGGAAPAAPAGG